MTWEALGIIAGVATTAGGIIWRLASLLSKHKSDLEALQTRPTTLPPFQAEPTQPRPGLTAEQAQFLKDLWEWHNTPDATEQVYKLHHVTPALRKQIDEIHDMASELAKGFADVAANQKRIIELHEHSRRRSSRDTYDGR